MEKKEIFSSFTKSLWAFNAGMWLMVGLHSCGDNSAERLADVQEHNAQLLDELRPDFPSMGRLVLNDKTDTFEFHVASEGEQTQTCAGEYEVVENKAQVAGDIACTSTVTLGG